MTILTCINHSFDLYFFYKKSGDKVMKAIVIHSWKLLIDKIKIEEKNKD